MKNAKQISIALFAAICITTPILTFIGIGIYSNSEEDYFKGIEISNELGILTEPIEIMNPKGFNVLYDDRYKPGFNSTRDNIIFNYRTRESVTATEYVLDGLSPQPIPNNNTIPKPETGNHSLVLLGINGTGGSCNSKIVYFYISNHSRGILGAPPQVDDITNISTAATVLFAGVEKGLKTKTPCSTEIFLEGPRRTFLDMLYNNIPYTKSINLKYELVQTNIPYIVVRSEPWYNHTIEMIGRWSHTITDGDIFVAYFPTSFLHVFGSITYWNGEIRMYDVIVVEEIDYGCAYEKIYKSNESILELPLTSGIKLIADIFGTPMTFYDKNNLYNSSSSFRYTFGPDFISNEGFEGEVFLGKYDYDDFTSVSVRFSIPQHGQSEIGQTPSSIRHEFKGGNEAPDDYVFNYRGIENAFSFNIYSI